MSDVRFCLQTPGGAAAQSAGLTQKMGTKYLLRSKNSSQFLSEVSDSQSVGHGGTAGWGWGAAVVTNCY